MEVDVIIDRLQKGSSAKDCASKRLPVGLHSVGDYFNVGLWFSVSN